MTADLHRLRQMEIGDLVSLGAECASAALSAWPREWEQYKPQLELAVAVMADRPPPVVPLPSHASFALTQDAFLAIRRAVAPSRAAVLVVDVTRAAARAYCKLHTNPSPDALDYVATQVYDALQLLEELGGIAPVRRNPRDRRDSEKPRLGF